MNRILVLILSVFAFAPMDAQVLSLDSCRAMALRSNKQMSIARVKQEVAENTRKVARTKYLPHVDLAGGYMYTSRQLSILNDEQKDALTGLGSNTVASLGQVAAGMSGVSEQFQGAFTQNFQTSLVGLVQQGVLTQEEAKKMGAVMTAAKDAAGNAGGMIGQGLQQNLGGTLAAYGDALGDKIKNAFDTDTHHTFVASMMLTQPIFMGGAIDAGNRMADIAEEIAGISLDAKHQDVLYSVDNAYWTVVSLRQKQRLADSFLSLVEKLNADVHKMIDNGVATRADGLKVDVAVNEAEMTKVKVDNGLALAKMYLCKLCGMDLNSNVTLQDEQKDNLDAAPVGTYDVSMAYERRPEMQLLSKALELSKEHTKLAKAGYMPQIALTGGVLFSSPSLYNGFERKFKGMWNVGVMLRMPLLDWGETTYKIRAARCATTLAQLEFDEAHELIELQINQCNFKVREANKQLAAAKKNISRAEENLRCANLGFKEGVMQTTDVMAAQTAWMQAQSQKIDAEIEVKMSETALRKALGDL